MRVTTMSTMNFDVDTTTGLLMSARQAPSPNFNYRPEGIELSLLVIHNISLPPGEYGGGYIDDLFCNRLDPQAHPYFAEIAGLRVSAHLLIGRDGGLVQYVPLHRRAWHAGVSCYQGRENCNDFSIGIELEGVDDAPYDPRQYAVLLPLVEALVAVWPALGGNIVGHCDIAPGRKSDPGPAFDWSILQHLSGRQA